jgi:hypothetical protein
VAEGWEFPKAIYRDGGEDLVWGLPIETSAVGSEDEEREALALGWRLHPTAKPNPLDHDGDGHKGGSLDGYDQLDTEKLRALAVERKLGLHHKTGRDKLLAALRGE